MIKIIEYKDRFALPIIILCCYLSRLPQLISPYRILDGDECVVAMQAKQLLQGMHPSLYFMGQQYGFSFIEMLAIVPFYMIIGYKAVAVQLAMLTLWCIGILFLYKTLQSINIKNRWLPFLLIMVLIWHPVWAVWSLKARGGYITAFTLSNICLYVIFKPGLHSKWWAWAVLGFFVVLIKESQVFWLTGLLPLMIYILLQQKARLLKAFAWLVTAVPTYMLLADYRQHLPDGYTPPSVVPRGELFIAHLLRIPKYFYHHFHGWYFFDRVQRPIFFTAVLSIFFCVLIFIIACAGIYYMVAKKQQRWLIVAALLFIPLTAVYTMFSSTIQPRYLLPVSGFLMLAIQIVVNRWRYADAIKIPAFISILFGIISLITFWQFEALYKERDKVFTILQYLKQKGVKYVVCRDTMLTWQLIFYSEEQIIVRAPYLPGRYPPYTVMVDNAIRKRLPVAFVSELHEAENIHLEDRLQAVDFIVGLNPVKQEISNKILFDW